MAAVQSQTGSENAFGGLAQAAADNIPILFLPDGAAGDCMVPSYEATVPHRRRPGQDHPPGFGVPLVIGAKYYHAS